MSDLTVVTRHVWVKQIAAAPKAIAPRCAPCGKPMLTERPAFFCGEICQDLADDGELPRVAHNATRPRNGVSPGQSAVFRPCYAMAWWDDKLQDAFAADARRPFIPTLCHICLGRWPIYPAL